MHTRSKTVDNIKSNHQKLTVKALKQQKSQFQTDQSANNSQISKINTKKRSKTTIEAKQLNFNNKQSALKTASTASTYNPDNYSPRPNEKSFKFNQINLIKKPNSNNNNKNVFTLKTNAKRQITHPPAQRVVKDKKPDSEELRIKNVELNDDEIKQIVESSLSSCKY